MSETALEKSWLKYCQQSIEVLSPILKGLGFILTSEQVHIGGERYLFSNQKLVLLGQAIKDNQKVVIKVSREPLGIAEIEHERECRLLFSKIKFAYQLFLFPPEVLFVKKDGFIILITEFIEQPVNFLERDFKEQFFLSLKALENIESVQATTYEHAKLISRVFGRFNFNDYWRNFVLDQKEILNILPADKNLAKTLEQAGKFLLANRSSIELYTDFLSHWDLVPHNLRIKDGQIYLLDHSAFRFGSKHETWARLINFMVLHQAQLATNLLLYLKDNRPVSEYQSLQAMRVFRLVELIKHYTKSLGLAEGNLKLLNQKRIWFWSKVLQSVLDDTELEENIFVEYKNTRDSLRSEAEKIRQKNLH